MSGLPQNVVLIAGGVGGARMAEGLARALPPGSLTVIANVGDDEEFYGLRVSPDIDTLLYTLSDRIDRKQGWGVADDGVRALNVLGQLGAPVWMKLGDADFGLHIWRSWRLAQGASLSEITEEVAQRLGASARVLPATDDALRTKVRTDDGWLDFQQWFVGRRCEPRVHELRYQGASAAMASPAAVNAIAAAGLIVFAPSNPLLSIEPILAVGGIRDALAAARVPRIGISPLIGGRAVKGPLARLMADLGLTASAGGVARRYTGMLQGFVVDTTDRDEAESLRRNGLDILETDILMRDPADAERLASEILDWATTVTGSAHRSSS